MDKSRPILDRHIKPKDLTDFYWLKVELTQFCKENGIPSVGGKIDIANRIKEYLETAKIPTITTNKKEKLPQATTPITKDTVIGIEYRTYIEKRDFLKSVIGNKFHFTAHLLDYFKKYTGKKTYSDLIFEWHKEQELNKDPNFCKEILPQFEYNTYIRDFLKDNPTQTRNEAIQYWKIKKLKAGDRKYTRADLTLI